MKFHGILAAAAMPLLLALGAGGAAAYDNDEQALRIRDTVADPSVPLAWDRRHHPETWRYRRHIEVYGYHDGCGKRALLGWG